MAGRLKKENRRECIFEPKIRKIKCKSCGEEFEVMPTAKFQRKYCLPCSKKNKEYYGNLDSITVDDCED